MTAKTIAYWLAAGCALLAPGVAYGQAEDAFCEAQCYHEDQWFAPVDFDFDCQPIRRDCGWTFNVDKTYWAVTGERVEIGNGQADTGSLGPWRLFSQGSQIIVDPLDPDNFIIVPGIDIAIPPPELLSGLDNGVRADWAWGTRYEVGYFNGDSSWSVGIMDGRDATFAQNYGILTQDPLYGSVQINFDDPLNLMFGFIDVIDALGGPFAPDGIADDVNVNGQYGPDGFDTEDPGREPDVIAVGVPPDFGDLVRLPVSFQFVSVRNTTETDGIELMKSYRLSNLHRMTKHQNNDVEVGVGVRYMRLRDQFLVNGTDGTIGDSFWDTKIDNNLVGPQIMGKWTHQRHRMRLDVGGRFMFAYNISNFEQDVALGEAPQDVFGNPITDRSLLAGQYNRPLYFNPTVAQHGKQENDFSPTVEFRAAANYQITRALSFKLGYTAIFIDNINRSAANVKYELPNMGFRDDVGTQHILLNGVDVGLDLVF